MYLMWGNAPKEMRKAPRNKNLLTIDMTTLTPATKRPQNLTEVDREIARIRQNAGDNDLSDFARYEVEELLELRRKMILGQFRPTAETAFLKRS